MQLEDLFPYFLVIGVISLMIAPILWMQPSPRQKQLARLRMEARAIGLIPQIVSRPDEVKQTEADTIAKYSLMLRENKRTIIRTKQLFHPAYNKEGEIQAWMDSNERLVEGEIAQILTALPQSSYLVELVGNSASLYWKEAGESQQLKNISSAFSQLLEWYKNNH